MIRRGPSNYLGMVLDISRTGLFVQTSAGGHPGDEIALSLNTRGVTSPIRLSTEVMWLRKVPQQLRRISKGGFGLKIRYAPESYYHLLAQVALTAPSRVP